MGSGLWGLFRRGVRLVSFFFSLLFVGVSFFFFFFYFGEGVERGLICWGAVFETELVGIEGVSKDEL